MSREDALKELQEKLDNAVKYDTQKVYGISKTAIMIAVDALDKIGKIEWLVDHMNVKEGRANVRQTADRD